MTKKSLAPRSTWYLSPLKDGKHPSDYHHPYLAVLYFSLLRWSVSHFTPSKNPGKNFHLYCFLTENFLMKRWAYSRGCPMAIDEILSWELRADMNREIEKNIEIILDERKNLKEQERKRVGNFLTREIFLEKGDGW